MAKEQERKRVLLVLRGVLLLIFNLIWYSLLLFAFVWICKSTFHFSYQIFGEVTVQEAPGIDVDIVIDENEEPLSFAKELEEKQVVVNAYSFYIRTRLDMMDKMKFRPGEYTLNTSMTYEEILNKVLKSEET